ncbi:sensor histidine kinase [Uliginosibacterium gangwonense]|uniref:sensor histidine kinase n=1 Tax=Uliginosibacterium gangwonense TaxID=392736 RepID=UPI00036B3246|nr:HAMP domain-containing sensor histidine kinase [Uliginosibacterium gangwonense]
MTEHTARRPYRLAFSVVLLALGLQVILQDILMRGACFAVGGLALAWIVCRQGRGCEQADVALPASDVVEDQTSQRDILLGAGHDLRQPVQAISLFAASLAAYPMQDAHRKLVAGIESGVHSLSGMLEAVFGIVKLQAGRIACQTQIVVLEDALAQAVDDKLDLAHERQLHLRHATTRRQVQADPSLLKLALGSMLEHALAQTPGEGGVLLGSRRRGDEVWIELRHGGKAKLAMQQDVFIPGEGYCDTLTDKGYGLAYAEGLARLMGGRLEVFVMPEKGCLLRLSLQAA